jgi:hypothetical protein
MCNECGPEIEKEAKTERANPRPPEGVKEDVI